jgi:hypothetical protein
VPAENTNELKKNSFDPVVVQKRTFIEALGFWFKLDLSVSADRLARSPSCTPSWSKSDGGSVKSDFYTH